MFDKCLSSSCASSDATATAAPALAKDAVAAKPKTPAGCTSAGVYSCPSKCSAIELEMSIPLPTFAPLYFTAA